MFELGARHDKAFDRAVTELAALTDGGQAAGVQSVSFSAPNGYSRRHTFYTIDEDIDLRSVSKVLVAIVVGIGISEGLRLGTQQLSLDLPIAQYFDDYRSLMTAQSAERFSHVQLWHLMSNVLGHEEGFLFRKDVANQNEDDLLSYIFAQPLAYDPGVHFSYSNVGWYLLSAMFQRATNRPLEQWMRSLLLDPLEIESFHLKKYGEFEIAASGVCLSEPDLHKVARLFLDRGMYADREIVAAEWLDTMGGSVVRTSHGQDPRRLLQYNGYGYGLWITDSGVHYCDGSAGQFLGYSPAAGVAVSATSDVSTVTPVVNALCGLFEVGS